jgi:signal peptidase I
VGDLIRSIIGYAITIALIVGGFKFYKYQAKATIDANDQSMKAEEYPYGNYAVNNRGLSISDYRVGDVVAYYLSAKPAEHRVARIVAVEGQKVEVSQTTKLVKVDGKATTYKLDGADVSFQDWRVPRGCVFVLSDKPGFWQEPGIGDSTKVGPVPYYNLLGKLN